MPDIQINTQPTLKELRRHSSPIEERARVAAGFLKDLVLSKGDPIPGGVLFSFELAGSFYIIKHTIQNRVLQDTDYWMLSLEESRGLYLAVFQNTIHPVDLYGTIDGVVGVMAKTEPKVKPEAGFSIDPHTLSLRGLIHRVKGKHWHAATGRNGATILDGGNELLVKTVRDICTSAGIPTE